VTPGPGEPATTVAPLFDAAIVRWSALLLRHLSSLVDFEHGRKTGEEQRSLAWDLLSRHRRSRSSIVAEGGAAVNPRRSPLLAILLLAAACSTADYQSPRFAERAAHHQVIAVLPFEVVLTGEPPAGLSAAQIASIEEAESVAFQHAYYHRLLRQASVHRRHPIRVEIQPAETTNRLLDAAGISARQSWGMTAKSLARVLRVDAVISTTVEKTRYLSDAESFGADLAMNVVNEATEGRLGAFLPWGMTTTHDIWAGCELLDGLDGAVLWQTDLARATDWSLPANQVIEGFTEELARLFPYRG
jgi:hypothetical protein